MAADLIFAPEASQDIDAAYDWYERQRVGLGEEFPRLLRRLCSGNLPRTRDARKGA
jgi:hypothetical protein